MKSNSYRPFIEFPFSYLSHEKGKKKKRVNGRKDKTVLLILQIAYVSETSHNNVSPLGGSISAVA